MGISEIKGKVIKGKVVSKVEIGKNIAFINFSDGTLISVAHNGERISMMYFDELKEVHIFNNTK